MCRQGQRTLPLSSFVKVSVLAAAAGDAVATDGTACRKSSDDASHFLNAMRSTHTTFADRRIGHACSRLPPLTLNLAFMGCNLHLLAIAWATLPRACFSLKTQNVLLKPSFGKARKRVRR